MSFAISCQIRIRRGYARVSPPITSEMTGSALPMPAAQPVAAPSLSCSKRGMSIEGMPSLGGPPDLVASNGTVCREKSVRGHSARQLRGSAMAVPSVVPVAEAMSTANKTIARMRFRNLNGSPAEGLIRPLSASGSQCASFSMFARSSEEVTRKFMQRASRPMRLGSGGPRVPDGKSVSCVVGSGSEALDIALRYFDLPPDEAQYAAVE